MTAATQSGKAARGIKRICQACEARFYDLWRDPIVCPSCGAHYAPVVQSPVEEGRRPGPTGRFGWRRSATGPVPARPDPVSREPGEPAAVEDIEAEEDANAAPDDEAVLEQDGDVEDFSGLAEIDVDHPKQA